MKGKRADLNLTNYVQIIYNSFILLKGYSERILFDTLLQNGKNCFKLNHLDSL